MLNPYPANTESEKPLPPVQSHLDIPKMIMDSAKNVRWIIPFKKFGMVRVKNVSNMNVIHVR